jgi:kumamolisin
MQPSRSRPVRMEGTERRHVARARRVGPVDPAEKIVVILITRQRPDLPEPPGLEHWAATPHSERRYLTNEEADRRHGADQEDIDRIVAFAAQNGLQVVETNLPRRLAQVSGTVAQFDQAFGITLSRYETPSETYRGYDGALALPADVAEVVQAVFGLDNRRLAARAGGPPVTITPLTPPEVTALYDFPSIPPGISGQTVGIFEFGGGYVLDASGNPTDIDAFFAGLDPPLPPPALTPSVPVFGGSNAVQGGPGNVSGDDAEVALDIDVVGSVAVGGTIAVYFIGNNTETGWISAITTAIVPGTGQPSPSVITISWAWDEDEWSASQLATISSFFQLAGGKGVTVFAASGDTGSMGNADEPDGRAHVCFPACDPWVTAVGGTTIGNVSGSSFSEITWNDNGVTAGGISTAFPLPPWQVGVGVPPSINDGTTAGRGLPDIAGYANGYDIRLYGADAGVWWGTSEASPLYAGLIAVLNATLGYRLGWLNSTFYALATTPGASIFNDIDDGGSNAFSFTLQAPNPPTVITSPGYIAVKGWDACTGWGSIRGLRLYAALASQPIVATAIASGGDFGHACTGSWTDLLLTINNTGFGPLAVTDILSSSPSFLVPDVGSYPLLIGVGSSIDLVVRFQPVSPGSVSATLTIISNDPSSPQSLSVSGTAGQPRLSTIVSDAGNFGTAYVGAFADELLLLNNSSTCALEIASVTSSSGEFLVPGVESYPLAIGPGSSVPLPIRFAPTSPGAKSATLTVWSTDPSGPRTVAVCGEAPCPRPCSRARDGCRSDCEEWHERSWKPRSHEHHHDCCG